MSGADPEISKMGAALAHHGWSIEKVLGFRWSKKTKITLETISFWQNISISIFKFSQFLYTVTASQWNLINFSKFTNTLMRKEKRHLCSSQWEKKNWELGLCFIVGCFTKSFNMIINHLFQAYSKPNFCFFISGWSKKYQKRK